MVRTEQNKVIYTLHHKWFMDARSRDCKRVLSQHESLSSNPTRIYIFFCKCSLFPSFPFKTPRFSVCVIRTNTKQQSTSLIASPASWRWRHQFAISFRDSTVNSALCRLVTAPRSCAFVRVSSAKGGRCHCVATEARANCAFSFISARCQQ